MHDPRIDAYIANAGDFAKPLLVHLREIVHGACPQVEETLKWGMPTFMYQGMLCGMAAFKQHCAFSFWLGALVTGGTDEQDAAMGQFGRIARVADLPPTRTLIGHIKKAMALNEAGVKSPTRAKSARPALVVPDDLATALATNCDALATFEAFSPSQRREYIEWISGAKRADTRTRRLATALERLAEGKPRNWKYMNC